MFHYPAWAVCTYTRDHPFSGTSSLVLKEGYTPPSTIRTRTSLIVGPESQIHSCTFPLEVMKRRTSVVPRVDEVVVGEDGGVRVAHDQHGATAEVLSGGFIGQSVISKARISFRLTLPYTYG